jgi:hypothetical protein
VSGGGGGGGASRDGSPPTTTWWCSTRGRPRSTWRRCRRAYRGSITPTSTGRSSRRDPRTACGSARPRRRRRGRDARGCPRTRAPATAASWSSTSSGIPATSVCLVEATVAVAAGQQIAGGGVGTRAESGSHTKSRRTAVRTLPSEPSTTRFGAGRPVAPPRSRRWPATRRRCGLLDPMPLPRSAPTHSSNSPAPARRATAASSTSGPGESAPTSAVHESDHRHRPVDPDQL